MGVLLVVCCVVAEMEVYVDIEEGRVLGKTIEFTEEEFANVSAKINTFKVSNCLFINGYIYCHLIYLLVILNKQSN